MTTGAQAAVRLPEDSSSLVGTANRSFVPAPACRTASIPAAEAPLVVIEAHPGWRLVDVGELWRARGLLFFLAWRDVKVRYRQTVLGAAWALLQPVLTMLAFIVFLQRVAAEPNASVPYALFVFTGMLPWTFFARSINAAGGSVVLEQPLITKVYFPRLLIPMSAIGAGLVDFAIGFGLLAVLIGVYRVAPGWGVLAVPLVLVLLTGTALGVGTLLSALTVVYRDFAHALPFLLQIWMFATATIYMQADSALSPRLRWVMMLNPAHGLIANFRAAVLGGPFDWPSLAAAAAIGMALFFVGCLSFRRMERPFVDII
jgi:lipopolysaccharide transport system permease protein